jgi:hypothetical protein
MESEHYRVVLSCYRAGRDDPTQPEFAEALAGLKADAELAAWYAEECRFDAVFRKSLLNLTVPPECLSP